MMFNYILPIGKINNNLPVFIGKNIMELFNIPYRILDNIEIPSYSFNRLRNQYDAEILLKEIRVLSFDHASKIITLIDKDIFSRDYKYIFGQAEAPGNLSIISTKRLNPEYYGQKFNQDVFFDRTLKEVLHEIGHNYNLSHCPDRNCVMFFSNTLADTDYKNLSYCKRCENLLKIYNN